MAPRFVKIWRTPFAAPAPNNVVAAGPDRQQEVVLPRKGDAVDDDAACLLVGLEEGATLARRAAARDSQMGARLQVEPRVAIQEQLTTLSAALPGIYAQAHYSREHETEADGFAHLYTIAADGGGRRQLTSGRWEVLNAELSADKRTFYLTTSESSPFNAQLYRMAVTGGARTLITSYPRLKVLLDLGCSSHNAMWETNRTLLFDASAEWLANGRRIAPAGTAPPTVGGRSMMSAGDKPTPIASSG